MVLVQSDVAQAALDVLDSRDRSRGDVGSLSALGDQRAYRHLGVMSRQVVEPADGRATDCGVDAVVIVEVQPAR
jgi:hypothetical protein